MSGNIDEVRIWNVLLTDNEVELEYRSFDTTTYLSAGTPAPPP
jgi:hypothetical protein